ncbi:FAD-dependent oxidoreductase [Georgenia deserti]|uniref:FAD-dependent oxidoreductase n=1 Tax=Georgenia deserti TaxID=2093781 RepID=A0ABW4L8E5_9MICO
MRCVVVGAGAWGLPAAATLAGRGHAVVLIDRYGLASPLSSSTGPTRIWRMSHPDRVRTRLALRSVAAMDRLARRAGTETYLRRGLLWRDDVTLEAVADAFRAEQIPHQVVDPEDVGRFFPGLRSDGRGAIWHDEAGPVLAETSLRAQAALLEDAGGEVVTGTEIREVRTTANGTRVEAADGRIWSGDVVVLAPGPGAQPLLASLGIDLPFGPRLQQVVHLADPAGRHRYDDLPCVVDGPRTGEDGTQQPALYSMPTPGVGFKIGIDEDLRPLRPGDTDRTPDEGITARALERGHRDLGLTEARVADAQVCSWTASPDGRFVIDRLDGGVVIACGDTGEGFKFSALMGEILADLAEGATPDEDVATFTLDRFGDDVELQDHVLGR